LLLTHAGVDVKQFMKDMRKQNKLIMGIGRRIKSPTSVWKSSSNIMLFNTFPTMQSSSLLLLSSK
jgi:hypothetical protein